VPIIMIEKIISGGQSWPEIAALDIAVKMGIPYTGWQPEIEVPSSHGKTDKYRLHTLPSNRPKDAIVKNVTASDGTFILSHGRLQELADYARQMTLKHRKQILGVDLGQHSPFEAAKLLASWLEMNHIKSLFVTGPAGEKEIRIYHQTVRILESALVTIFSRSPAGRSNQILSGLAINVPERQLSTAREAVHHLVTFLSLKEKTHIAATRLDLLLQPGTSLNRKIQKVFSLQTGNQHLMQSCLEFSAKESVTPDEASRIILKMLWENLRKTHRLRIIK
jgi:hypothetical protein